MAGKKGIGAAPADRRRSVGGLASGDTEEPTCRVLLGGWWSCARAGTTNPRGLERTRRKGLPWAGPARARRGVAGALRGPRSGCWHSARETMSGGSSCSQTPSRAIPATHRVDLRDGVQLPPGDYSTTPGGTLFSTTPGGRRGLAESRCGRWGGRTGQSKRDWDGATRPRVAVTGKNP